LHAKESGSKRRKINDSSLSFAIIETQNFTVRWNGAMRSAGKSVSCPRIENELFLASHHEREDEDSIKLSPAGESG
jgi:hypothetical protein